MWKYLTEKSIRHRFAKSRKIRAKRFVPYREASTIVVLADMEGAQQVGEALRVIGSEGKKIVLYHFTFALQKAGLSFPGIDTVEVSLEDLCQGNTRPRSEICRRFESLKPDVLVDLTLSDYLPVAYLVASSNAPMRLGLKKDSLAPADIMVQLESEQATAEGLLRNLLFYWKNIAVKNNNS